MAAAALPALFLERMQRQLGPDFENFLKEYQKNSFCGLRVNTGRISAAGFCGRSPFELRPVPWTENGFYYDPERDDVTRHPHYFAGLYYIQEPSAMLPASRLPVEPGNLVLDLCAAPGGKSTELAARLQGDGLLIANDVSATRAKALVKNLSLWGISNCCVTAETPRKLWQSFGCCFDRILVDAPCSGEGMFRKDASLIRSWEKQQPEAYAPLQKEILEYAARMLKPGGFLLYSTCTFSEEEDEQTVASLLSCHPELSLESIEPYYEGFTPGKSPLQKCVRVWPHKMKGEGHFLALFRRSARTDLPKKGNEAPVSGASSSFGTGFSEIKDLRIRDPEAEKSLWKIPAELKAFLDRIPQDLGRGKLFLEKNGQCYLLPPYRLPSGLRFLCTGLFLGTLKKGRFEPSQPLAMALDASSFDLVLDLPSADLRIMKYLKGETIEFDPGELKHSGPKAGSGWTLVCTDGFALGWGKAADGKLKNKYSPGWRIQ